MVLTGCTTTSDHLYIFPNGSKLEDQIEAAKLVGCRFHAARGFMSVGESKGGLPPDSLTEDEDFIIKDSQRVVEEFNNPDALSMLRVVIAPCSPFSVSQDLMKISAEMARNYNITLHTHLAENDEDIEYSMKKFNKSSVNIVAASDAFFPFPDSSEVASKNGITCIIQPGGSINDEDVVKAADRLNISMIFTNRRLFSH